MPLETSYSSQGAAPAAIGSSSDGGEDNGYWPLSKLRKCYSDYLFGKREEQDEQIDARRYYHGSQWTAEQLRIFKKRRQPAMTFNRVARKIDGVVGLIEKLRQDPKAYARTPQHEQGAELATATLRYVMDQQDWNSKSPECAQDGAVDGIGGIEINIEAGDQGDPEINMEMVDIQSFFYDPRSYKADFSDARFKGVGKWVDQDVAKEMFPKADFDVSGNDFELASRADREIRWYNLDGPVTRLRLIDIWYKHKGGWCYAIFTGSQILMEGKSYLQDEKKKDICKYVMFSGNVDQDGDRYGFVRNMKSAQDGINAKQSKMQHILASRRLIISQSSVIDVEKTRAEWARPDGVVTVVGKVNEGAMADDQSFDFAGFEKMLELNLAEIENFGPNPALIGTGVNAKSGRAISLMQQAGMAELGPYIMAFRSWKIRVYRAIWNAVQQHWKGERWVRVTDDQSVAQYIQINGMQVDPQTGQPGMVNPIGSLDVDIILDEGPDTVTIMQDMYETLSQVVPSLAPMLSPPQAQAMVKMLVDTSPMDAGKKKQFNEATEQAQQQGPPPDPKLQQQAQAAELAAKTAEHAALLEQQKAEAKAQGDQQAKAADIQMDAQAQQQKTAGELEALRLKNEATIQLEREKAAITKDIELFKAQIAARCQEHQSEVKTNEMRQAGEMDRDNKVKEAEAKAKPQADAVKPMADALERQNKHIESLIKSLADSNKPKRIRKNKDGSWQSEAVA